jgi:CBS-domain-containing membrane protein
MLALPDWRFLLTPTLLGASIIVGLAAFNNAGKDRRYPKYWF